jgi:hypothetical protein
MMPDATLQGALRQPRDCAGRHCIFDITRRTRNDRWIGNNRRMQSV